MGVPPRESSARADRGLGRYLERDVKDVCKRTEWGERECWEFVVKQREANEGKRQKVEKSETKLDK